MVLSQRTSKPPKIASSFESHAIIGLRPSFLIKATEPSSYYTGSVLVLKQDLRIKATLLFF